MITQFRKGIVELLVLKLIRDRDLYGFEVISQLEQLKISENTIYPILRRLTNQGYFTTYTKKSELGAPRKYYSITRLGTRKLTKHLNEWTEFNDQVNEILGGYDEK